MLNGKKFAVEKKPLFMMKAGEDPAAELENQNFQCTEPEMHNETIVVSDPLSAVFCYYRYYIFMEKYKAIMKFNLNHPAYFKMRD